MNSMAAKQSTGQQATRKQAVVAKSATKKKVAHAKHAGEEILKLRGRVESFRTNHHEDVDGLKLGDGVEVRFPPHIGHKVCDAIEREDKVRIVAHRHITQKGDAHLHVDTIENIKTGKTVKNDSPHGKQHGKKHKKHKKHGKKHSGMPPHEEMLAEINAIRALLDHPPRTAAEDDGPPHERVLKELRKLRRALQADA
jgi:hypothetical protein